MSKTLFNQNVFQSKNVTNSDDVQNLKVDTFKATTLTATTIINTELQNATTGVASNLAALANKQDTLTATNLLNVNFITAENDDEAVIITNEEFGTLTGMNTSSTIQSEIDKKAKLYDVSSPLVKTTRDPVSFGQNPILLTINNTASVTDGSADLITSGGVFTGLAGKQATLSTGDGIDITGNTISFDGIISQDITTSGTITGATMNYVDGGVVTNIKTKIDANTTAIAANDTDIASNTSVLTNLGSAVLTNTVNISSNTTAIAGKQATLTDANNAGTNISISGSGVISATGGTTYSAASNGGLALSGTAFSVDYTNLNSSVNIPQTVSIENDTTPQLLLKTVSENGNDAELEIRGGRAAPTNRENAKITFSNYDGDLDATNILGSIHGRVSESTLNIGGLIFDNYPNGSTRKGAMTMSSAGNFWMGANSIFQNNYKLQVTGNAYVDETLTAGQIKTNATNTITGNGNSDCSVVVDDGILLCDGGSGNGTTNANGVLQVNARNSGKLVDCAAFRAQANNNNILNFCNTNGNVRGRVDGDGSNNVSYRKSSDRRLKENVNDLSSCWELVKELNAKRFNWIEDGKNDVGFIAQEVYALDGFVTMKPVKNPNDPDDDKYYCCDEANMIFDESGYCEEPILEDGSIYAHAIDYGNFTPYLWKALQEAIIKIEALETKVTDLEAQIIV